LTIPERCSMIRTVFETQSRDRRVERRAGTRAEVLDAAWESVRRDGLAALSLRDLAPRVGLRAPSLYSYFASKNAIYDAMFAQAAEQFIHAVTAVPVVDDPVSDLGALTRCFVDFGLADVSRYQLLFQRTVPGFEPSPESYRLAVQALDALRGRLGGLGIDDPAAIDMATALATGLVDQQISNDPDGDRWTRLVDDACRMLLDHYLPKAPSPRRGRS
jgi:AcrR family transcriptional regulator